MRDLSFLLRQRRWLVLAAVSLLAHALAIDWVAAGLGAGSLRPGSLAAPVLAKLKPAMAPPAVTAASVVSPAPAPVPTPLAPAPVAVEPAVAPVAEVAEVAEVPAGAGAVPVPEPLVAPPVVEAAAPPVVAASGAEGNTPPFQVRLPPSADLALEVVERRGENFERSGSGLLRWRSTDTGYTLSLEAGVRLLVRISLLELNSSGQIGVHGLEPQTFSESRLGRARTDTHFDRAGRRISFSRVEGQEAWRDGGQDRASLLMQLAAVAYADPRQLEQEFVMQVADTREAAAYHFVFVGREELDTRMGKLQTWHVARPPRPGAYNQRLDIWLAPDLFGYPVQVRQTDPRGHTVTNTITEVAAHTAG